MATCSMNEIENSHADAYRLHPVLNDAEPSAELLEWAQEHIGEDPDKRDLLVSELRDMIFERGECIPHRTDDDFLLRFLRARHFIVRKAHRLMVNYCEFRESAPQYFVLEDIRRVREMSKTLIISAPPYYDQLGRRMLILNVAHWNPSEYSIRELIQLSIGIIELSLLEPQTQIKGGVFIVDLSGFSLEMAWYMTPTIAKHIVDIAIHAFPMRTEAVHVLHSSWIFDIAWNMFRPLIADSLKDRIFFHGGDMDSLHQHIDPKCLPERYGGVHVDYPFSVWFEEVLLKNEKVIKELEREGYNQIRELKEEVEAAKDVIS